MNSNFLCLALVLCVGVVVAQQTQPTFPNDWTASEIDSLVIYQGDYTVSGDNYCCSSSSTCQVQTQYQAGTTYFDYSHNRTRFDQFGGDSIVSFYDLQRECLVVNNTCQEYCPMGGDVLEAGFLDPNATDMGARPCGSGNDDGCELWEWKDTILGIVVMEISDVLVNQTDFNNAIPLSEVDQLTPFGEPLGTSTSSWTNFVPGTPPASLFDVQGVLTCPLSQNCDSSQIRTFHRIRNRAWLTFMRYKYPMAYAQLN